MNRYWLFVSLLGLASSCSQQQVAPPASLAGTNDVLWRADKIFVTSSRGDEVRVLNTVGTPTQPKGFVTGPNPLAPLSIPTLPRPTNLSEDVRYSSEGFQLDGNYVFATRAGASEISVIGAKGLVERKRLVAAAPVTASSGWLLESGTTRLYFTTFDGAAASLFSVDLPADETALAALSNEALQMSVRRLGGFVGNVVKSLLAVPQYAERRVGGQPFCSGAEACLLVSTRSLQGGPSLTQMVDPQTLQSVELNFGSAVRELVIAPRVAVLINDQTKELLHEGERVFALLDESQCTSAVCSGVVAVDTKTANDGTFPRAKDFSGAEMLPIITGESLPIGLSVAAGVRLAVPAGLTEQGIAGVADYVLLGAMTLGDGQLLIFDGFSLTHLDGDSAPPEFVSALTRDPAGLETAYFEGPIVIKDEKNVIFAADGAFRSQSFFAVQQGPVPGLLDAAAEVSGTTLTISSTLTQRIRAGDAIELRGNGQSCLTSTVTAVGNQSLTLQDAALACPPTVRVRVRAGAVDSLVFSNEKNGYLGRAAPETTFQFNGPELFRPVKPNPPGTPSFRVDIGKTVDAVGKPLPQGTSWTFVLNSHFQPFIVGANPTDDPTIAVGCGVQLPGRLAWDAVNNRIWVSYPSGDGVVEFDPARFVSGSLLGRPNGVFCYR
jgi:hypothetical protein